jgi:hypothetical protein
MIKIIRVKISNIKIVNIIIYVNIYKNKEIIMLDTFNNLCEYL